MQLKYEVLACLLISKNKGVPALTVPDFRILYRDNIASLRMTLYHLWNLGLISRTGEYRHYTYSINLEGVEALGNYLNRLERKSIVNHSNPISYAISSSW
jgi:predicted MarR family transcription regulator